MDRPLLWTTIVRCFVATTIVSTSGLFAADAPVFPTDSSVWINSAPLTTKQMRGKAIFLWFFEETCPTCRARWPALLEKARESRDQPIVFVAVNSGNSPADIQEYAQSVECTWPMLADVDRNFERACGLKEINLQNVNQAYYISADGELHNGDWSKIDETIESALKGAHWKVDPKAIPEELHDAWLAIEFGRYAGVAASLKKWLNSRNAPMKAAAGKLQAALQNELTEQIEEIKQAKEAGQSWKAYELCQAITSTFSGIELPAEFKELRKSVQNDSRVKAGIASQKTIEKARRLLDSGQFLSPKLRTQISNIARDYANTNLAESAQQILQRSPKASSQTESLEQGDQTEQVEQ